MRRLRYSVPYIAGKNLPKDSDPAPCGAGPRQPDSLPPRNDFNPLAPCGAGPLGSGAAQTEQNFNPPAPCGAGLAWHARDIDLGGFQSTRPLRGGTRYAARGCGSREFQSTRPLRGGTAVSRLGSSPPEFQSTRPLRGGTASTATSGYARLFQSTRPLRGGTFSHAPADIVRSISIHPPLAGRDTSLFVGFAFCSDFNPPAPCGAGPLIRYWAQMEMQFQSTRPLRGGTLTYAPSGERAAISIHPPLAGRDSDLAQKNCAKHRILHKKCIYPGRIERFSGFDAAIFLPNVHKFRCEPSEESLLTPRSHAYTIRTPSC